MLNTYKNSTKKAVFAAVILLLGGVLYYVAVRLTVVHNASAQVKAVPFVAEMHSYAYKTNPAGELLTKKILARRSDGTTVSIHSAGPVEKGWNSRKIQYMDGRYVGIVDRIASILHGSANSSELAALKIRLMSPPQNCLFDVSFRLAGYEQVFGRRVAKVIRELPDGVHTGWYDPELGCEMLQSSREEKASDGSLKLISRTIIVGFSPGEPNQRLFEEPLSYEAVTSAKDLEGRFGSAVQSELPLPAQR